MASLALLADAAISPFLHAASESVMSFLALATRDACSS